MIDENTKIKMSLQNNVKSIFILLSVFLIILFNGCVKSHIKTAKDLSSNKHYEEALGHYLKALKSNPESIELKIDVDRLLKEASQYYYYLGMEQEKMRKPEMAVFLYQKSLEFDPANNSSRKALSLLINLGDNTKSIDQIKKEMEINVGYPEVLNAKDPVDLIFKHKVSLMKIFEVLAKTGNVNILFDSGFRDRKVTFSLKQSSFHKALERLCMM
ncbi:MAG: tetratricopeptide repeat protein, partial [Candidatus Aminicenantes bacterium]|nr:tetratricopeptide repeat protein [Candidatus Aminicenantes bacterium]